MHVKRTIPVLSLLLVTLRSIPASPCPSAPRNTSYSEDFYRAQLYYLEQTHAASGSGGIATAGVILGGEGTSKDWSQEKSGLDETKARRFVTQELSRLRAQLVAECASVLCELGKAAPTTGQLAAIDATSRICSQALLEQSSLRDATPSGGFHLTPPTQFVFFDGSPSDETKRLVLYIENDTTGTFQLQLDGSELPPEFRERNVCSRLSAPGSIELGSSRFVLPFVVHRPSDLSETKTVVLTVRDKQQQKAAASAQVVLVPSLDPFRLPVRSSCGEVKTDANITCTAVGGARFTDGQHDWYGVPFSNGPNMGFKGQTACMALTTTTCSTPVDNRTELGITSLVGGQCGPDASNTGGDGNTRPQWRSGKISIPALDAGDTILRATARLDTDGIASFPDPNAPLGDCTLSVVGATPTSWTIKRDRATHHMPDLKLAPGDYDLEVTCPAIQRGCYGSPNGTTGKGTQVLALSFQFDRVSRALSTPVTEAPICSYSTDGQPTGNLPVERDPTPPHVGCAHCTVASARHFGHEGVLVFLLGILMLYARRQDKNVA